MVIEGLGVRHAPRWILQGFDLRMKAGEKVVLAGPSGSGKSTLLQAILGLVVPQKGTIHVCGQPVDGVGVWEARRRLAYVAQEPDLGAGTVREMLEQPLTYKANAACRGHLSRVPVLMRRFHLPEALLDKECASLSGGEKQRFALISALLLDRPVMLLDEAMSALDRDNRQAVAAYFDEVGDRTVLAVAHDGDWPGFSRRVLRVSGATATGVDPA